MLSRITAFMVMICFLVACSQPNGRLKISAPELEAVIGSPAQGLTIVDVREPELFRAGHIPGAINLPYPAAKELAPAQLNASENIVFVCHTGPMGDELAGILAAKGYPHVRNLNGGMENWTGPLDHAN